jgi:hypothetical protein
MSPERVGSARSSKRPKGCPQSTRVCKRQLERNQDRYEYAVMVPISQIIGIPRSVMKRGLDMIVSRPPERRKKDIQVARPVNSNHRIVQHNFITYQRVPHLSMTRRLKSDINVTLIGSRVLRQASSTMGPKSGEQRSVRD